LQAKASHKAWWIGGQLGAGRGRWGQLMNSSATQTVRRLEMVEIT